MYRIVVGGHLQKVGPFFQDFEVICMSLRLIFFNMLDYISRHTLILEIQKKKKKIKELARLSVMLYHIIPNILYVN